MLTPSSSSGATNWGVDNLLELKDVHYSALQVAKEKGELEQGLRVLAYDPNSATGANFGFVNIDEYIKKFLESKSNNNG